jgi:ectoine hydroxylase-related dioxygenase (phytanoyl-CoA dioxygenase family)
MNYPQLSEDYPLRDDQIARYRKDGFIKLDDVITGETLQAFREAVADGVTKEVGPPKGSEGAYAQIFIQRVNIAQRNPEIQKFVKAPRLANLAAKLSGTAVRLWHDQALFKEPGTGNRTPWHQDAPYWPHQDRTRQISIWLALKDATVENGCMSFLPGTQNLGPREPVEFSQPKSLEELAPEAAGIKPVTHELKAGSTTFHSGLCFHYAGPNRSQSVREAMVVIYMPADTL